MFREWAIQASALVPSGVKRWIYRHPRVLQPMARLLKRAVGDAPRIVRIAYGPNEGMLLEIDHSTPNYYWMNADYESDVVRAMCPLVRAGMRIADIGAHIGFDTLLFSRLVGPEGLVVAFEPDPQNVQRLQRNCEINHLANVRIVPDAVSETSGVVRFASSGETTSHLAADVHPTMPDVPATIINVRCTSLDEFVYGQSPQPLDLLKIDVENHELKVLRGARRLLREGKPVILVELHSPEMTVACAEELLAAGYRVEPVSCVDSYQRAMRGERMSAAEFAIPHVLCVPPVENGRP